MARNYIRWLIRPAAHCKEGCCKSSKRMFIMLVAAILAIVISDIAFAMCGMCDEGAHTSHSPAATTAKSKTVDAGNTICPVTGEKIEEASKATYEYAGKIYNFCCPMCIDEFKKDPEKYIAKIKADKAASTTKGHSHSH